MQKRCATCGLSKGGDDFQKNLARPDGMQDRCRECVRIYNAQRYAAKKHVILAKNRIRREELLLSDPTARDRERDRLSAWRAANPERWKENLRRAQANARASGLTARTAAVRRARESATKRGVVSLMSVLLRHGRYCGICNKPIADAETVHYDHVVPLARGGLHVTDNLRPAHRSCNSWKNDRLDSELIGLTPPKPDEVAAYVDELKRQRRSEQVRARMAAMTPEQKAARGAKISASRMGYVNPPEFRGKGSKGRKIPPEEVARRAAAVQATYDAWTPEQREAHAAKISATKRARGAKGNVENLSKGWTPEVRAKAIAASAELRRGKKQSPETIAKRAESLKKAWADGRYAKRVRSPGSDHRADPDDAAD